MNPHRTIVRSAATALVALAYVALSAASVGCGGGNNNTPDSTTTVVAVFTPDTPTAADGSITLLPGTTSGAAVNVRVTATQMPSVFGAAFRIRYDATALLFNGMDTSTSVLNGVANPDSELLFLSDAANTPGEIVITATRVFPAVPVAVTTTSDLVILNFVARRAIAAGAVDGRLDFVTPRQACDGTVAPPGCGSITVTAWKGGGVSAQ
jgi:hypothetical protein